MMKRGLTCTTRLDLLMRMARALSRAPASVLVPTYLLYIFLLLPFLTFFPLENGSADEIHSDPRVKEVTSSDEEDSDAPPKTQKIEHKPIAPAGGAPAGGAAKREAPSANGADAKKQKTETKPVAKPAAKVKERKRR
jgi:hypothetical protein